MTESARHKLGWIGTGRMGFALCERLLDNGCDLHVYNRTKSKAAPLADLGATVVDHPSDLADRDIVFTMVAGPSDVIDVTLGPDGVLAGDKTPKILVDSTTIDVAAAERLRAGAAAVGTSVLAAPVSGNPKVVRSGQLTCVVSGPPDAFEEVLPYLEMYGRRVTFVGKGDEARLVKICHNLMLGIVAQTMAEITVLAEAGGVKRHDFLAFLNDSVMGSTFTRYKTPAYVNLDWSPTFTSHLLKKDFDLGLDQSETLGVPLPTSELVHSIIVENIESGFGDLDFGSLLELEARKAGQTLESEVRKVSDGL